jgi:excinuclease ABC subunit C
VKKQVITDGIEYLKARLKSVPTTPGVYRMLNEAGDVLYVGKAKHLRNRLTNYTQAEGLSLRIRRMVFETRELVLIETGTEAEALLLEANLIKSMKPKYNIKLTDDSSYPSILITKEATPMIKYHRGAKRQKGDYFGPYPTAGAVHQTLDLLERAFRLRSCKPSVFKHRTRPCLKYDIKRCSAPCVNKISATDYAELVREAKLFLSGRGNEVQKQIAARMQKLSADMNYESAATERDRLEALAAVGGKGSTLTHALSDADVFALARQGGRVAIQAFFYRGGRHMGNQTFFPKGIDELNDAEVLRHFLALYYVQRSPQPLVLVSDAVADVEEVQEALSLQANRKIELSVPQRGEKLKIIKEAQKNAAANLARKLAESDNWQQQMQAFGELLSMDKTPARIECFDISNISGKQPVASMVVAGAEGMLKSEYRKFKITVKDTPDDYAMLRETLTRRYKRVKDDGQWPDVVMVDGGKGQLNVLLQVFDALEIPLENRPKLTCIVKGEERDKGEERILVAQQYGDKPQQLDIPFDTPLIFVLQRIRDEAHRFAITFHRQQRSGKIEQSLLDTIPNIGAARKKALLLHFGSVSGVKGASVDELTKVEGISGELAQTIYDWLH